MVLGRGGGHNARRRLELCDGEFVAAVRSQLHGELLVECGELHLAVGWHLATAQKFEWEWAVVDLLEAMLVELKA